MPRTGREAAEERCFAYFSGSRTVRRAIRGARVDVLWCAREVGRRLRLALLRRNAVCIADEAFIVRRDSYVGIRQQPSRGYGIRVRMEFK